MRGCSGRLRGPHPGHTAHSSPGLLGSGARVRPPSIGLLQLADLLRMPASYAPPLNAHGVPGRAARSLDLQDGVDSGAGSRGRKG